jgi:hypothetical protein
MLVPFVFACTHEALCVFDALAEVVSAVAAHAHPAFTSFLESFYLVASAAKT